MLAKTYPRYKIEEIERFMAIVKAKQGYYYPQTDQFLYYALERYSIANKTVLIMGKEGSHIKRYSLCS